MELDELTEIAVEVDAGVAVVTLNRPDRRNAWNGRMAVEYRWALHHAHTRPDVRVVVLTGAGGDFCVGADARALDAISSDGGRYSAERLPLPPYPDGTAEGLRHNHAYPLTIATPVIAALTGACAGAGFVLATYADLRFVAGDCRITTSFARMGLPAEYGIGWLLPRMVGLPAALELLYTAEVLDGAAAVRLGWAQRRHEPGEVLAESVAFARALARGSSAESLRTMKRQLFQDAAGDFDSAYARSVADMNAALRHPDMREGLAALRERRPTDFLARPGPGS
ncbi:enoyl-CoA hydratase-related protein [Pseudonocardia eucalypti]|uniref:Enoyl-CoA hydratase-related protein n=1 Tax=Pseudonocardia eucalypti TaxID=648755 RepID=A0ABP9Q0L6_9PSEU|nr:enoyl-CoA hydratase/carnithine racemase [Pseudonocardia eucalypti]